MELASILPISMENLLRARTIEENRIEYKATWDERVTPPQLIKTVCAFANDLQGLNGGYIVLGVETENGIPVLPARGIPREQIDPIQLKIAELCRRNISPVYLPVVSIEKHGGADLIVVWAPAGQERPYTARLKGDDQPPKPFVRVVSSDMEAQGDLLRQLLELTGRTPFDDRRSLSAQVADISSPLVRRYLSNVRSGLAGLDLSVDDLLSRMRLVTPVNGHTVPRNAALMFFSDDPDRHFPGARIEVVQFGDDAGGNLIEERTFRGPLDDQIRQCTSYLAGLGGALIEKVPGRPDADRAVAYPFVALEEALANAIYHRGYESVAEPTKVYLYPDRMEITSFPGPVSGITLEHLHSGRMPPVPPRNRRIGEMLKELRLAEARGTGIPKIRRQMTENGSPEPVFDFDEPNRTYFRVTLPVHPKYLVLHALREAAHLWATGSKANAIARLARARDGAPSSGSIAGQLIEYHAANEDVERAAEVLSEFDRAPNRSEAAIPYTTMARVLLDRGRADEARTILARAPSGLDSAASLEQAILLKRSRDFEGAHQRFESLLRIAPDNPKVLHEFAQTKIELAKQLARTRGTRQGVQADIRRRLNTEAAGLLRRAIQLTGSDSVRAGWCWFDLAKTLDWLRHPPSEVEEAFQNALANVPGNVTFMQAFDRWKSNRRFR